MTPPSRGSATAVRVRRDGTVVCAAMHPPEEGDTYLHDGLSYKLSVELRVLVTEPMTTDPARPGLGGHAAHGLWWWRGEVPEGAAIDPFYD